MELKVNWRYCDPQDIFLLCCTLNLNTSIVIMFNCLDKMNATLRSGLH